MDWRKAGMLLLMALILAAPQARADGPSEAGVIFLKLVPGARAEGLGEAFVAQTNDATAIWWNPGAMAYIDKQQMSLMYANWLPQFHLSDLYFSYVSYVHPVPEWGTVGGSITFMNYGTTQATNETGQNTGTFHSYDVAFTGAYGSPVTNKLGIGVGAKFIYSHLSDQGTGAEQGSGVGTSLAVDVGVMYRQAFTKGLTLAATLTNMGPAISYIDRAQADPLPMTIRVGASYKLVDTEFNRLTVNADLEKELVDRYADGRAVPFYIAMFTSWSNNPWSNEVSGVIRHVGMEYWYSNLVGLRTGYYYDVLGQRFPVTFGFSLAYSSYRFDFGYISAGKDSPLTNTMIFSLNLGL
jgi:hypothetical protein